jgi:hypothetical protein
VSHRWTIGPQEHALTLATVDLGPLVEAARAAGLDGQDRGAVRRLVWSELGSDAVDHDVVTALSERLSAVTVQPLASARRRDLAVI